MLSENAPALAVGGYAFGTERGSTDQNIFYVKAAKTVSIGSFNLGRFSAGWFWGNNDHLLDGNGDSDARGVLLTWERTLSEISEKLWVNLDYQGSKSAVGALMPAFAWKFAPNVAVVFGYVIPNESHLVESFAVELDIDFEAY